MLSHLNVAAHLSSFFALFSGGINILLVDVWRYVATEDDLLVVMLQLDDRSTHHGVHNSGSDY